MGSEFIYYSNALISSELNKHQDLREKYLGIDAVSNEVLDTIDTLENWRLNNNHYVYTKFFDSSYKFLDELGFVMIQGEAMSGKTELSFALANRLLSENPEYEPIILTLDQFENKYRAGRLKKVFIFDNVFGDTSIDEIRHQKCNKDIFSKLAKAIDSGAKVIFTTREYIFNKISEEKDSIIEFPFLFGTLENRKQIIVKLDNYSGEEAEEILYKHIKHGDLPTEKKTLLKPFLKGLAALPEFKPEIARRLGINQFHNDLVINQDSLEDFFRKPIKYFQKIFNELSINDRAALLSVFLEKEGLIKPLNSANKTIFKYFNVDYPQINIALDHLNKSFVKTVIHNGFEVWYPYHLSMKEAITPLYKNRMDVFLNLGDFNSLIDETSCNEDEIDETSNEEEENKRAFVAKNHWPLLVEKLFETYSESIKDASDLMDYSYFKRASLSEYFAYHTSDEFLIWFNTANLNLWAYLTTNNYTQIQHIAAYDLANRLLKLNILDGSVRKTVEENIENIATQNFDLGFGTNAIRGILGEEKVLNLLEYYNKNGIDLAYKKLEEDIEYDLIDKTSEQAIWDHHTEWQKSVDEMKALLIQHNLWTLEKQTELDEMFKNAEQDILELADEVEDEKSNQFEIANDYVSAGIQKLQFVYDAGGVEDILSEMVLGIQDELDCSHQKALKLVQEQLLDNDNENGDWLSIIKEKLSLQLPNQHDIFSDVDS